MILFLRGILRKTQKKEMAEPQLSAWVEFFVKSEAVFKTISLAPGWTGAGENLPP